jgi:hypothetical protein
MTLKRPPLWIVAGVLLLLVLAAVPLTCPRPGRPADPPRTLTELARWLSQDAPDLVVVPASRTGDPETGVYICNHPQSWDELVVRPRNPRAFGRWRGVVFCERVGEKTVILEESAGAWGEHGRRLGPLLLFGDPELLRRIDQVTLNRPRGNSSSGEGMAEKVR